LCESFARCVSLENPKFLFKKVEYARSALEQEAFITSLFQEQIHLASQSIRYTETFLRELQGLQWVPPTESVVESLDRISIQKGQTFWITGGVQGIAYLFAEYLTQQAPVQIIFTGVLLKVLRFERSFKSLKRREFCKLSSRGSFGYSGDSEGF
jgi:hypothetical protein